MQEPLLQEAEKININTPATIRQNIESKFPNLDKKWLTDMLGAIALEIQTWEPDTFSNYTKEQLHKALQILLLEKPSESDLSKIQTAKKGAGSIYEIPPLGSTAEATYCCAVVGGGDAGGECCIVMCACAVFFACYILAYQNSEALFKSRDANMLSKMLIFTIAAGSAAYLSLLMHKSLYADKDDSDKNDLFPMLAWGVVAPLIYALLTRLGVEALKRYNKNGQTQKDLNEYLESLKKEQGIKSLVDEISYSSNFKNFLNRANSPDEKEAVALITLALSEQMLQKSSTIAVVITGKQSEDKTLTNQPSMIRQ